MSLTIRTTLEEPETGQAFIPHRPERPPKADGGKQFRIVSEYQPSGDQPTAIAELVAGIEAHEHRAHPPLGAGAPEPIAHW